MLLVENQIGALQGEGVQKFIETMFLAKYFKQIILQQEINKEMSKIS